MFSLSAGLSASISGTTHTNFTKLSVHVAPFSSGGAATGYVFPDLRMTSYFLQWRASKEVVQTETDSPAGSIRLRSEV